MRLHFRLDQMTISLASVFLIGVLSMFATSCRADDSPKLAAELGHTVIRGPTIGGRLSVTWPKAGPKDADFECGLSLIGGYDYRGKTYGTQAIADCLLVGGFRRFDLGVGPAYLQDGDGVNGSHFNFALMARYRFTKQLALAWRHWSNGGSEKPNDGRDLLVLAYQF